MLTQEAFFTDNWKREGVRKWYNPDGTIKKELNYIKGKKIKESK